MTFCHQNVKSYKVNISFKIRWNRDIVFVSVIFLGSGFITVGINTCWQESPSTEKTPILNDFAGEF